MRPVQTVPGAAQAFAVQTPLLYQNSKDLPFLRKCQRRLSLRRHFLAQDQPGRHFLAQAQSAWANCQRRLNLHKFFPCFDSFFQHRLSLRRHFFDRRLSLRRHFFSAGSACIGLFLAHTQHAQKIQNGEYLPQSSKKNKNLSSPQVTYPYKIYWCKKKWVENLTLGHL